MVNWFPELRRKVGAFQKNTADEKEISHYIIGIHTLRGVGDVTHFSDTLLRLCFAGEGPGACSNPPAVRTSGTGLIHRGRAATYSTGHSGVVELLSPAICTTSHRLASRHLLSTRRLVHLPLLHQLPGSGSEMLDRPHSLRAALWSAPHAVGNIPQGDN
jgi:hypothetical protein